MWESDGERLVGVYVNGDLERKLSRLREWMEDGEERVRVLISGDFNTRTEWELVGGDKQGGN